MQRFETNVSFECPACGEIAATAVEVPEPDWNAAENFSDLNSEGATEVVCNRCRTEFPAYVTNSAGSCHIVLDDHERVDVSSDMAFFSPEEQDWLEHETKGDPYAFFNESYRQAAQVLAEYGVEAGAHLVNRMVFAQQVSALEAYLGDTLMRRVAVDSEALQRLIEKDKELLAEKVSLTEIAKNPDILRDRVKTHLRAVLYHNLKKVDFLYQTAFRIRVLGTKEENAHLLQAIQYRHHCVHRNGMDQEGNRLTVFTPQYVKETADRMKALVDRIQFELYPQPPPAADRDPELPFPWLGPRSDPRTSFSADLDDDIPF